MISEAQLEQQAKNAARAKKVLEQLKIMIQQKDAARPIVKK